jgi:hypothetical protein
VALCSGLAPLTNNHFGRCALLWGRLRLHAINATALIELEMVLSSAIDKDRPDHTVYSGDWDAGRICEARGCPENLLLFWSMAVVR